MALVYDHLLTFDREVELFWKGKVNTATVLFFLNRYIVLGFNTYALANSSIPVSDVVGSFESMVFQSAIG